MKPIHISEVLRPMMADAQKRRDEMKRYEHGTTMGCDPHEFVRHDELTALIRARIEVLKIDTANYHGRGMYRDSLKAHGGVMALTWLLGEVTQ